MSKDTFLSGQQSHFQGLKKDVAEKYAPLSMKSC